MKLQLASQTPGARILGLGSMQPDRVVTNHDLEKIVETNDEWIQSRVGIVERRFGSEKDSVVSMGVDAGSKALADAGLAPTDLDAVIVATCTMPKPIPNAAAQTADRIGVNGIGAFDVNTACAGFCYGTGLAGDMIRSGTAKHVLVIGSEKLSDWLDMQDRSTCIIFADGAGAAVLGPAASDDEVGVGPVIWGAAGDLVSSIHIDETDALRQEGQAVFRWATTKIAPVALRAVEAAGLKPSDIDVLVPHQANLRIVEAIAKRLRQVGGRDDLRVADDIQHSGNTSSASIPLAIDHMRGAGRVKAGDVALIVGFGAGLSYAAQVVVLP
ncbi:3-oxoacyl-[acyl-carrier-protein] synthase 3 [Actinomycetospora sp. NBRC 106375]|uniref:beta-ketoacyl-ACP synthase III n=1 Tax=Actinomycetospora sp. NBRC 106375 TaxID=3032207 RepID=UPI0024A23DE8|nr:beta-ketoacyl-ACP synthase III [Actinomycetospora sp. NBRC 106375]GLZ49347.1 3-oxoacyl-[acyl-carrier-protein] synthase 3 [Actinomycetospora sp. NBRC 106375]